MVRMCSLCECLYVDTDLPIEWSPQPRDDSGNLMICAFVDVNNLSQEYSNATKKFEETMHVNTKFTIIRVQRVQNPQEYYRYLGLKATWQSAGQIMQEKELFHGTKAESISAICASGFNRIFAAEANGTC